MTPRVLLVEDESQIRRFVRLALEEEGCSVVEATSIGRARAEIAQGTPDLTILDLGLPDGDGITFIDSLRAQTQAPVLVLSARLAENSKVEALDAGADDYLTKPFGVGELRARVRALLRRGKTPLPGPEQVRFGNITVDLAARQVLRNDVPVHLTPIEFRLLCELIRHPGRIQTQRTLLRDVWGPAYVDSSHYLRVYVGHLRQKLEADPTQPRHFLTETGVGYRFQPDPPS